MSVVVATRDRPEWLARCLATVVAATRDPDELVVVDSSSRDAAAVRRAAHVATTLIRLDRPGVGAARNAGWRAAVHDLVLFTDDDVTVHPRWADVLAETLAAHPDAGFVTGRVLPPPGEPVPLREVALKRDAQPQTFGRESVGNLGHSANLGMHRARLCEVGGFDAAMGAGGRFRSAPEADLFDRVLARGHEGRYQPEAVAYHPQWRSPRQLLRLEARYGFGNGARLAKLLRTDRGRARLVGRDAFVNWGLADIRRAWQGRHADLVAGASVRVLSTCAGLLYALPFRVRDGHFSGGKA